MPERPLRIEMVVPAMEMGGMETMVADLSTALIARGHEVAITCLGTEGAIADHVRERGTPVTLVPTPGIRRALFPAELAAHFRRIQPSVVHAHSGVWLKAVKAARSARVPRTVYTAHGLLDRTPRRDRVLMRLATRYTDACVAVSGPLSDFLRGIGARPSCLSVIPNGVDTGRFHPGPRSGLIRSLLQLPGDALIIGTVARLASVKNHALLLAAFADLIETDHALHLVLVGDGPLEAELRAMANASPAGHRIHFLGAIQDTTAVYRDLDIFVLPSLAEGTSISILEAMATGLPIVATRVGGNGDLLAEGEAGVLIPSNDRRNLAVALRELAADGAARAALGDQARRRAVSRYSHQSMVDQYLALYQPTRGSADVGA